MRAGRSDTSKDWIARTPDSPATRRRQTSSRPTPIGVTSPMPVTTTRLMLSELLRYGAYDAGGRNPARPLPRPATTRSAVRLDKADRILDGDDLLGCIIGDLAAEFL